MGLVWACSALTLLGRLEIEQKSTNHRSGCRACEAGAKVRESIFAKIPLSGPKIKHAGGMSVVGLRRMCEVVVEYKFHRQRPFAL